MTDAATESLTTWAEDTALLRSNRSAVPGLRPKAGRLVRRPPSSAFGISPMR